MHRPPDPAEFTTFAAWLTAACRPRGAAADLARAANVTSSAVEKWLNGGRVRKPETIAAIADWSGWPRAQIAALEAGHPLDTGPGTVVPGDPTEADALARWRALDAEGRVYVMAMMELLGAAPAAVKRRLPRLPKRR
jgi:transcriptional regulator with XRE-family HTH domain